MLSRFLSFCLIFSLLFTAMSKSILVYHYRANLEYYAKVLCVNKKKPRMNCHGKCHLKMEMQKDEQKQKGSSEKAEINYVLFFEKITGSVFQSENLQSQNFIYESDILSGFLSSVFHPPLA